MSKKPTRATANTKMYAPIELAVSKAPYLFGRDYINGFVDGEEEHLVPINQPFFDRANNYVSLQKPRFNGMDVGVVYHGRRTFAARPKLACASHTMLQNYIPVRHVTIRSSKNNANRSSYNAQRFPLDAPLSQVRLRMNDLDNKMPLLASINMPIHPDMVSNLQLAQVNESDSIWVENGEVGKKPTLVHGGYYRLFANDTKATVRDLNGDNIMRLDNGTRPLISMPRLPAPRRDDYDFFRFNKEMLRARNNYPTERSQKQIAMGIPEADRRVLPWWLGKKP